MNNTEKATTQNYPTKFSNMVAELVSLGWYQRDIVQSAEFLKGRQIGPTEPVTQTLRNKTVTMLSENGAPNAL